MRKPLLSRGPLVFVATCFVCLLASSVSGQILKLPTPPAPAPKPSTTSIPILKLPTVPSKEVKSVPATARVPLIEDLSSRHIIFSKPANAQQAAQLQQDPRFLQQFLLRNHSAPSSSNKLRGILRRLLDRQRVRRDWAVSLGAGGVAPGMYAAKYTFDVTAFPSCTADFAVFPINASTGNSRASVIGTFTAEPLSGDTFSITTTPTGATLTLVASNASNTGLDFMISPTVSTDASRLAAAINRNLSASLPDRIVAVASGNTVTVYALTPGDGETLAHATTSGEFNWSGDAAGFSGGTQANIVAFNQLYSGTAAKCSTQPQFIFSYASGVGPVATSPTLSLDGTKIAYVENDPYIGAILHVLTYGTGSTEYGSCTNGGMFPPDCATAPVIPGSTPGSTATDAMLPLGLLTVNAATGAAGATDTFSSPYIHYGFDTLYVGDDNGYLYAIYPTFTATPAHAGGNFPVSLIAPAASETPSAVTAVHLTGVVTVTVPSTTGLGIGELVTIAGVAPHGSQCNVVDAAEINGTWPIASIPSGMTFTFDTMISMTTSPPGCTVTAATVTPGTSYVTAPSLDGNITGNLFVGDSSGNLYMVSSAGVQATLSLGSVANGGIRGGPIVDSTNSVGYAVAACSGGNAALTQFSFTATTMTKAASAQLESSGAGCTVAGLPTYDPTPDARYFDLGIGGATAASNGELIAAASAGGGQNINTFQFVGSVMQTPATATIGSDPSVISPLTEFFNNTFITSSMSSVTATQGTPGVVTVMAHNSLSPGDVVLISGIAADGNCDAADVAGINGMPTVTSATATEFTFNATIPDMTNGPCNHFGSATGGPDYMFMGVAQNPTGLYSFLLPSGAVSGTPDVTNTSDADGGTSGIIIDNDDAVDGQTASLYYGTLATSGVCSGNYCAIKVTQAMLQ
ncbi:MAG: hypothetical protein WA405_08595 [Candidatus Acidiferrales bacterium]